MFHAIIQDMTVEKIVNYTNNWTKGIRKAEIYRNQTGEKTDEWVCGV